MRKEPGSDGHSLVECYWNPMYLLMGQGGEFYFSRGGGGLRRPGYKVTAAAGEANLGHFRVRPLMTDGDDWLAILLESMSPCADNGKICQTVTKLDV